eukprot:5883788-Prymnesium_polylepis.1
MLSNTYDAVQRQSTLQWRLERVRRILRLELVARPPLYSRDDIRVGENQGGKWYLMFRGVLPNVEGVAVEGGTDLFDSSLDPVESWVFAPPPPSDDEDEAATATATASPSECASNAGVDPPVDELAAAEVA